MSLQDQLNVTSSQAKRDASEGGSGDRVQKAAGKRRRALAIAAPILVACIAFLIVLTTRIIPGQKLSRAKTMIDSGEYTAAYVLLDGIDYKNSRELQESIEPYCRIARLSEAEIGSSVFFGSYEQDNDASDGKEDIEWIVLAKEDDRALVISKYALDAKQYDLSKSDVTWETCTLRAWLNGPFLSAFRAEERNCILDAAVTADTNPSHSTSPGNDTTDKLFLLSVTEVDRYFNSDEARKCEPTAYAKAHDVWKSSPKITDGRVTCWWWLRSPGSLSDHAVLVRPHGSLEIDGRGVYNILGGVRPAMWIDLSAGG